MCQGAQEGAWAWQSKACARLFPQLLGRARCGWGKNQGGKDGARVLLEERGAVEETLDGDEWGKPWLRDSLGEQEGESE